MPLFDDLSLSAQKWAIEGFRDSAAPDAEMMEEVFADDLKAAGFPTDDIRFKIGHQTGDGVAFYGRMNLDDYLTSYNLRTKYDQLLGTIDGYPILDHISIDVCKRKGVSAQYDGHDTMVVVAEIVAERLEQQLGEAETDELRAAIGDLAEGIEEDAQELSRSLKRKGYAMMQVSDNEVIEYIRTNQFQFDDNGNPVD